MLLLFVCCGTASANGVVPLLTAFTRPETAPLTLGLTAGIILFEAWLLKRLFREGTYLRWLRVSAIINVASSLAGSFYLWMFKDSWQLMALGFSAIFELFIVTVVVEGALLCRIIAKDKFDTRTTVLRGVGLNLASYVGLFVLQIGFVLALVGWSSRSDKQRLETWQNKSVLEGVSGYIYAIGRGTNAGGRGLKRFEVATQRWESLVSKSPEYKAAYKVIKADYQHRIAVEPCPIRKDSLRNQFGTFYGRLLKHAAKMVRAAGLPCSKAASAMLVKLMDKGGNKGRKANKLKEAVSFKAYSAVVVNMVAERFAAFADKEMGFTPKTELDNVLKLYRSIGQGCGVDFEAAVTKAQLATDK